MTLLPPKTAKPILPGLPGLSGAGVLLLLLASLLWGQATAARAAVAESTLRIASAFDPQTMDPHALALLYHTRVVHQIYESLVGRDARFRPEPALALSWQNPTPLIWRFKLRAGVRFHDGSAFTATDAAFSIERARAKTSQRGFQLSGIRAARALDPQTLELTLEAPDAVLPDKLFYVAMMSRAWCEARGVQQPQDFAAQQETQAVRKANGTGPYQLLRYEPDVRSVLQRHAGWWGWDSSAGLADRVEFITIRSDATRLAALNAGAVEIVLDPPFQDIARLQADSRFTLLRAADPGQQYLMLDQWRDELPGSDVKGRNPFKDLRVRQAVMLAINAPLIADKVLRGQALPAGALLSGAVDGAPPELQARAPADPARARALLAEAGYGQGFSVAMDCVNTSWREAVCQSVAAMLAQVGIRVQLRAHASGVFFPKLTTASASLAEFGWSPTPDAWFSLNALLHSHGANGAGAFNGGRYRNPQVDALIDSLRVEPDLSRRREMVGRVLRLAQADLPLIPLFSRRLTWAVALPVQAQIWPNDAIELRWVRLR